MDTGTTQLSVAGDMVARELMRLPVDYAPPQGALEEAICGAFSRVLRVEPVGRDDEFYDLGGDSLAGEALSLEIQSATGQVFPISSLFRHATPAAIGKLLAGTVEQSTTPGRFFIVHGRGGYTSLTPEFRAGLKADRNVTMFELPGIRGEREPIWNIRELAQAYVDQINREQPEGPVQLAAFCAGTFIALEMADLLAEGGRPLDRLVLIDPLAPLELKARHEAETLLEQSPGSLTEEQFFQRTGRYFDPAKDAAMASLAQRRMAERYMEDMAKDKVAFVARYKGMGFADWPRAVLMTLYRMAWPKPFRGQTFIIASAQRVGEVKAEGSLWRRLTPNINLAVVSEKHSQIGRGDIGRRTAATLEEAMAAPV